MVVAKKGLCLVVPAQMQPRSGGCRGGGVKSLSLERMQGCAADPVCVKGEVFAYVGLPQNLKDLKDWKATTQAMVLVIQ